MSDQPNLGLGPIERALVLAEMLGGLSAEDREYRTVDHD